MSLANLPFVSVILPIRDESAYIGHCFRAILQQDYPGEMEILIADGMSTDNTRSLIHDFSVLHPQLKIQVLDNPSKIVPTGINIALRQAKGEIIIRVDGHTVIAPDYVRQCVETLQRTKADNVGGKMNAFGEKAFAKAVALATSTPFGIGGGRFHVSNEEEWVDTVYMGAWPRRVFDRIGLFDEELVRDQDDEFNYRLREQGGRILLSPSICSEYTVRSTPGALWKQYFQYGFWKVRVLQKHPRQMSPRQFMPPAFVLALLLSSLFFLFSTLFSPLSLSCALCLSRLNALPSFLHPSAFIPFFYLLSNLTASLWTVIMKARTTHYSPFSILYSLLFLPLVFAILHLSYGFGFLIGLVKFWDRWGDKQGQVPECLKSKVS
ncbi:MAG: glycosyltransferase family 2 protein [Chloroflexi bacterium]|nr:glycosyltransferase family 2 protein [Chloroflexota bacterium]